jgi:hypothetical protein
LPHVSIEGVSEDVLNFLGIVKISETDDFDIYEDFEGRVSMADKANPYVWVDDINDAIQMGSKSIITRDGDG